MEEEFKKCLAELVAASGLNFSLSPEGIAEYIVDKLFSDGYLLEPDVVKDNPDWRDSGCEWDYSGCSFEDQY